VYLNVPDVRIIVDAWNVVRHISTSSTNRMCCFIIRFLAAPGFWIDGHAQLECGAAADFGVEIK
jgi:hypothetical protein